MKKEEYLNTNFFENKLLNKNEKNCVTNIKLIKCKKIKLLLNQNIDEKYSLIEDQPYGA